MLVPESRTGLALVDSEEVLPRRIDRDAVQHAVSDLLLALGADIGADGLRETPRRVADAYWRRSTCACRFAACINQAPGPSPRRFEAIRDDVHIRQEFLAQTARTSHDR